jgi:hypothetical protein
MQKGIIALHTNWEKSSKLKGIALENQMPLAAYKGSLIAIKAIAKYCKTPFRAYSIHSPRIACNADNVSNIPLGKLNLNF